MNNVVELLAAYFIRTIAEHALCCGIHILNGPGFIHITHAFNQAAQYGAKMRADLIGLFLRGNFRCHPQHDIGSVLRKNLSFSRKPVEAAIIVDDSELKFETLAAPR